MEFSRTYFGLFVIFITCPECSAIKGYNFADSKLNGRRSPDDGFLQAQFDGPVPSTLSICVRFNQKYERHGNQLGLFHILIPSDEKYPLVGLVCNSKGHCLLDTHNGIIIKKKEGAYPKVNWLRKWTSICVSMDFDNNQVIAAINGKEVNRTELEKERKELHPLDHWAPKGYFSGKV